MPPKAKFSKEQIVQAGLAIVRNEGMDSLTARALGKRLGCSSCPIFTVFDSMEEVQAEVIKAAKALYAEYVKRGLGQTPAFKGVGMQYILFSIQEPKLFQLLFMSGQPQSPAASRILPIIEESYGAILSSVKDGYRLGDAEAERLYRHLWIYTHGIATLCATNMCVFTQEEMSAMLTEVCVSVLKNIKGGAV